MQKQLEYIKTEITQRIHKKFIEKFNGNQREFARAASCDEKTIRKIFNEDAGLTLNLFFKLCYALETEPSEIIKDLKWEGVSKGKK